MKILTVTEAQKKLGLAKKDFNAQKIRYDLGKYKPEAVKGAVHSATKVVWYEHRKDNHGPYVALYTVR
jgi:hypothetical protein